MGWNKFFFFLIQWGKGLFIYFVNNVFLFFFVEELYNGDIFYFQMGLGDKVLFLFIFVEIIGIVDGDGLDDEINFSLVLSLERRYVYIYIMFICRVCWYRNISISMIEYLFFV